MKIQALILAIFISCTSLVPSFCLLLSGNADWHCCFSRAEKTEAQSHCSSTCSHTHDDSHASDSEHSSATEHSSEDNHPCNPFSCHHTAHVWVASYEFYELNIKQVISEKPHIYTADPTDHFTATFWHPPCLELV